MKKRTSMSAASPTNEKSLLMRISERVNLVRSMSGITSIIYMTGSSDEIEMIGQTHNVNDLFNHTMKSASELVLEHFSDSNYSDFDVEFTRGQLIDVVRLISNSAWFNAKCDYELAKKYCDSSIFLIKEILSNTSAAIPAQEEVAMPEKIEEYTLKTNALVPCIETIMEIRAIRNDEIRNAILGGMDIEKMTLSLVKDTFNLADAQAIRILIEEGVSKDALGTAEFKRLQKQMLDEVKTFFGIAMKEELRAMKESGQYEPIYPKTLETVKFFMPIAIDAAFGENIEEKTETESTQEIPPVAQQSTQEVQSGQQVAVEHVAVEEEQPQEIEGNKEETQTNEIQNVSAETVASKEVSEPVAQEAKKENGLPGYTQAELNAMPIVEKYKILALIKKGEALLVESKADLNSEKNATPDASVEIESASQEVVASVSNDDKQESGSFVEEKNEAEVVEGAESIKKVEEADAVVSSDGDLPIYTQEDLDSMPIVEKYRTIAAIKKGEAMLIEGNVQERGMGR